MIPAVAQTPHCRTDATLHAGRYLDPDLGFISTPEKVCLSCGEMKPREAFPPKYSGSKDSRRSRCGSCYERRRKESRPDYAARKRAKEDERKRETLAFIQSVKMLSGCMECGKNGDPENLHFHHVGIKRFELNDGLGYSYAVLIAEMAQCIVLCQRCHKRTHVGRDLRW